MQQINCDSCSGCLSLKPRCRPTIDHIPTRSNLCVWVCKEEEDEGRGYGRPQCKLPIHHFKVKKRRKRRKERQTRTVFTERCFASVHVSSSDHWGRNVSSAIWRWGQEFLWFSAWPFSASYRPLFLLIPPPHFFLWPVQRQTWGRVREKVWGWDKTEQGLWSRDHYLYIINVWPNHRGHSQTMRRKVTASLFSTEELLEKVGFCVKLCWETSNYPLLSKTTHEKLH